MSKPSRLYKKSKSLSKIIDTFDSDFFNQIEYIDDGSSLNYFPVFSILANEETIYKPNYWKMISADSIQQVEYLNSDDELVEDGFLIYVLGGSSWLTGDLSGFRLNQVYPIVAEFLDPM